MKTAAAIWILGIAFKACSAKDNTLAITPPMGWSSWNAYGGHQVKTQPNCTYPFYDNFTLDTLTHCLFLFVHLSLPMNSSKLQIYWKQKD